MKYIVSFILVISALQLSAQKIESTKVFGGYLFTQNEEPLSIPALLDIMEPNSEAVSLMKAGKSRSTMASILGGIGGGLIGIPIGTAIGGGEPVWSLAGVGAGFIVMAIPVASAANKKMLGAVEAYNSGLNGSVSSRTTKIELLVEGNRTGIRITF